MSKYHPAIASTNSNFTNLTSANKSIALTLAGLLDVGISSPSTTNVLTWSSGKWTNAPRKYSKIQYGSTTIPKNGNSSTANGQNSTITFPTAFTAIPIIVATVSGQTGSNYSDTFACSVSSLSPTQFSVNLWRLDANTGWSQTPNINWIAILL